MITASAITFPLDAGFTLSNLFKKPKKVCLFRRCSPLML